MSSPSIPSPTMAIMGANANLASASASAISRTQRCGVCEGCLAKACGSCVYCKDNPQFGGPGVKKQSCVARRCIRVLEGKLQREAMSARARKGCGTCDECLDTDCDACLVCMDKRFFQGQFLPDALCAKKKCSNAKPMEPTPTSPKVSSILTPAEKKARHHSYTDSQNSLNGSSRKTPASNSTTGHHHSAHYPPFGGSESKKKKLDHNSGTLPSTSTALLRPMAMQPVSTSSAFAQPAPPQQQQQQQQQSSLEPVTLMERAFSYVIQHPPSTASGIQPSSIIVSSTMVRHPAIVVQPRPPTGANNGASPPAGTTAPMYRSLPIATPLPDNLHATWNPQNSKVLFPTSIETFTSSTLPVAGEGYIVTLDGDQLKQHLSGQSAPWTSTNSGNMGDSEDIELQQKLIEFYQRDKNQQHQQSNQNFGPTVTSSGNSNQGQYYGGQSAGQRSSLPPSIVAEPIAPMGQSEVVLQQL